ncbi:MAG: shikimate kinase [Firmicutes bacterium HGW-Firmicutes-15]|nr:MAG: shikimate kinase [Firmicutes bacterium HGW-Firmicutes-15]
MGKNIVLIGFMGTGKSSIGVRLAQKLKMEFVDMDREIELVIGISVAEIFKRYGELRFRSEELLMARKVSMRENIVIATGGGTVLIDENVSVLRENGMLICLDASPEDIFNRVNRKRGTRPLLNKNVSVEDIERLLQERERFYACADIRVNTSAKNMDAVLNEIIQALNS